MARKSTLRAVGPDDKPATDQRKKHSILEASENGTRLDELKAMRRRIAVALDNANTPPRDLAALSRRHFEIGKEIELIESAAEEESGGDNATPDEDFDTSAL